MNTSKHYVVAIIKTRKNWQQLRNYLENPIGQYLLNTSTGVSFNKIWDARQKCWKKLHMYERQLVNLQRLYLNTQLNNNK